MEKEFECQGYKLCCLSDLVRHFESSARMCSPTCFRFVFRLLELNSVTTENNSVELVGLIGDPTDGNNSKVQAKFRSELSSVLLIDCLYETVARIESNYHGTTLQLDREVHFKVSLDIVYAISEDDLDTFRLILNHQSSSLLKLCNNSESQIQSVSENVRSYSRNILDLILPGEMHD